MLSELNNMNSFDAVVIESDNCTAQYKSAKHFNDLKKLSKRLDKNIICLYEIAGQGKGKVIPHWKVKSGNWISIELILQIFGIISLALFTF